MDKENKKKYKKFGFLHLTGKLNDLITTPWRSIVLAGILVLSFASFQVSQSYLISPQRAVRMVLGVSKTDKPMIQSVKVDTYRKELHNFISQYIIKRSNYISVLSQRVGIDEIRGSWLEDLDNATEGILDLTVPGSYQEVHLEIVILLNEEIDELSRALSYEYFTTHTKWQTFFSKYPWLSSN